MKEPIVKGKYKIEKFQGKGGWHYVLLKEDLRPYKSGPGWVKVKGKIDSFEIEKYNLAPFGEGKSMLALNANVRKIIKKGEGDTIELELYLDDSGLIVPTDFIEIIAFYPKAIAFFEKLIDSQKIYFIDYISETKNEEIKLKRINTVIDKLEAGKKFYDL